MLTKIFIFFIFSFLLIGFVGAEISIIPKSIDENKGIAIIPKLPIASCPGGSSNCTCSSNFSIVSPLIINDSDDPKIIFIDGVNTFHVFLEADGSLQFINIDTDGTFIMKSDGWFDVTGGFSINGVPISSGGDGTGGWTNTSTTTSTNLNVNATNNNLTIDSIIGKGKLLFSSGASDYLFYNPYSSAEFDLANTVTSGQHYLMQVQNNIIPSSDTPLNTVGGISGGVYYDPSEIVANISDMYGLQFFVSTGAAIERVGKADAMRLYLSDDYAAGAKMVEGSLVDGAISINNVRNLSGFKVSTTIYDDFDNIQLFNAQPVKTYVSGKSVFSFYDAGQTAGTNNWGIYSLTANHYLAGKLNVTDRIYTMNLTAFNVSSRWARIEDIFAGNATIDNKITVSTLSVSKNLTTNNITITDKIIRSSTSKIVCDGVAYTPLTTSGTVCASCVLEIRCGFVVNIS